MDTFDPKPELARYAGKMLPMRNLPTERKTGAALPSPFKFAQHGQSGLPVSEIFPHTAKHADEICVLRSMRADVPNHEPSLMLASGLKLQAPSKVHPNTRQDKNSHEPSSSFTYSL